MPNLATALMSTFHFDCVPEHLRLKLTKNASRKSTDIEYSNCLISLKSKQWIFPNVCWKMPKEMYDEFSLCVQMLNADQHEYRFFTQYHLYSVDSV